jgi:hypothetical protein
VLAGSEYDKLEFDNSGAEDDSLMIDLHADGPYFESAGSFDRNCFPLPSERTSLPDAQIAVI